MLCEIQGFYSNYLQITICKLKHVEFWKWMQMRSDIHIYTKIPYHIIVSLIQRVNFVYFIQYQYDTLNT